MAFLCSSCYVNGAEYSQCQLRMLVVQYPQRQEVSPSCDMFIFIIVVFAKVGHICHVGGQQGSLQVFKCYQDLC